MLKEINRDKKDKRDNLVVLVCFLLLICMVAIPIIIMSINKKVATNEGKISAGYYKDLVGEDYRIVEAHFEAFSANKGSNIDLTVQYKGFTQERFSILRRKPSIPSRMHRIVQMNGEAISPKVRISSEPWAENTHPEKMWNLSLKKWTIKTENLEVFG